MIDQTMSFIVITVAGTAGAFLSYWMAFNAKNEPFDMHKHGNALITGVVTGLMMAVTAAVVDTSNMTVQQFGFLVLTTFGTGVGVDRLRSSTSAMTSNNPPTPAKSEKS
jgi:hypothetical protein